MSTDGNRRGPPYARKRPSDEELHEAMLTFDGRTSDVAVLFEVDRSTVWKWTQRPEYKAVERRHRIEARKRVMKAYAEDVALAFETARGLTTSEDPHAALNAARFLVGEHRALEKDERELEALEAGMKTSDTDEGESVLERVRARAAAKDFNMPAKARVQA